MNAMWTENLAAYSIQVALVVAVGGLAAEALRLKQPRVMLAYWQALLAAALLLPLLEPGREVGWIPAGSSVAILGVKAAAAPSPPPGFPLRDWLLPVLAAGAALGLLRLALRFWRLRSYRRAALPMAPLPEVLREAQASVGVKAPFFFSDRVTSPATFGWLEPAILLPRCFECMDASRQRAIACHELVHVARRDWLANLGEELILVFFWFHPAVWWAVRSIRLAREQVVDREVVALTGTRKPYLQALLEIAAAPRALPVPAPLFLTESQLARRVAALLKEVRMSKKRLIASLAIALIVVAATGWWAARTFWFTTPLGEAEHTVAYGSGGPLRGVSTFMMCMVESEGRPGNCGGRPLEHVHFTGPIPLRTPTPPYTPQAKLDKVQGAVVAALDVDSSGNVAGIKLTAVSLSRDLNDGLDASVIRTLRTWKFMPALDKDKPVPATVRVQVNFRLS
jgi:TonB family protein